MKKILVIVIILSIFLGLINFPSIFLKSKILCSGFDIYYYSLRDEEKSCAAFEAIVERYSFLKQNMLDIYVMDSLVKYMFFSFFSKDVLRVNVFRNFVILAPIDFEKREFIGFDVNFSEKLNEVVLRSFLLQKYYRLKYIMIDRWKIIGYSKYVSGEIQEFLPEDICVLQSKKNYIDFENMVVVKYLIDDKLYKPNNLFSDNISYDVYLKEAKEKYCR